MRVVFVTSEPQSEADQAKADWNLPLDWDVIGMPGNSLVLHLRNEYIPDLEIVGPNSPLANKYGGFKGNAKHPKLGDGKSCENTPFIRVNV